MSVTLSDILRNNKQDIVNTARLLMINKETNYKYTSKAFWLKELKFRVDRYKFNAKFYA
jgi:hypothetical protein